jgi:hypothetical protein
MPQTTDKTKIIAGVIVIIGIMALSYVLFPAGYRQKKAPEEESQKEPQFQEELSGILSTKTINIEEEKDFYIINVQYPQFSNMASKENQDKLNGKLNNFVLEAIREFKERAGKSEIFEGMKNGFYADYIVNFFSEKYLSLKLDVSGYYSGAAHPNNYALVFNYDIENGRYLELDDMFNPDSDYLNVIANLSRQGLFEILKDNDLEALGTGIEAGTAPEQGNYQKFGFSDYGFIVYFDADQVAPYAFGPQTVEISFTELADYFSPASPFINL